MLVGIVPILICCLPDSTSAEHIFSNTYGIPEKLELILGRKRVSTNLKILISHRPHIRDV